MNLPLSSESSDSRGYDGIIDGSDSPPDKKDNSDHDRGQGRHIESQEGQTEGKSSQQERIQGPCYGNCENITEHCVECHI